MPLNIIRQAVVQATHADEHDCIEAILKAKTINPEQQQMIMVLAKDLVKQSRQDKSGKGTLDAFLQEFGLSNKEGVALMCLAEALLRVPDAVTADRLIAEKIESGDWISHQGGSDSLFVNASCWGLMLTGKTVTLDSKITEQPGHWLQNLTSSIGEPIVRAAVRQAMKIMGGQYVLGRTIEEGIKRGEKQNASDARFSFDMLGEGARTDADALNYYKAYANAIDSLGSNGASRDVYNANGISVKLSALHPRYHYAHKETVVAELLPRIKELCVKAKLYNIGLSIDAEESERLDISLDLFETLAGDPLLSNWQGLGFVLQAYQKRAPFVAKWLQELGRQTNRRIMVRLVKGAYWDAEIKHAQEQGFTSYPVFTRKANTDLCYLHCAEILLSDPAVIYPQFATHNAYTAAMIVVIAGDADYEFQRLHGMGHLLYAQLDKQLDRPLPLRVYAPIGRHKDLLPYLVRRLLENGANSSFVNRFLDSDTPIDELIQDNYDEVCAANPHRHSKIPLPCDVFIAAGENRKSAKGIDLDSPLATKELFNEMGKACTSDLDIGPIIGGKILLADEQRPSYQETNPANSNELIARVAQATEADIQAALINSQASQPAWQSLSAKQRGDCLIKMADLLEEHMASLIALISAEAGRTIADGLSEVREAIDFCRYYAEQGEQIFSADSGLRACGTFLCISPWNFPLAIFTGQIAAALVAGNAVLAKPAEQTSAIALRAVNLFHQAGVPVDVLQLLTGGGARIGAQLVSDQRIAGITFTGSTQTAKIINTQLAQRAGNDIPFIAETGGQNCLIIDSTALPEQVVDDVITSSFQSAGQRCSALRVLFIQEEIADNVLTMLKGAMQSLHIGLPQQLASDLGPVIDRKAQHSLRQHTQRMHNEAKFIASVPIDLALSDGNFFAPHVFEIDDLAQLTHEVFGPVLHVIRYASSDLDKVISQIKETGNGLTLGVHSRIQAFSDYVFRKIDVGNTYINRNMVGAVVGVNPFGGRGLSGTGPKAGGPNYLYRFCDNASAGKNSLTPLAALKTAPVDVDESYDKAIGKTIEHALSAQKNLSQARVKDRVSVVQEQLSNKQVNRASEKVDGNAVKALCETALRTLDEPLYLAGPTGEENILSCHAKGVFLVILNETDTEVSLSNQLSAILLAGCTVIVCAEPNLLTQFAETIDSFKLAQLPEYCVQSLPDDLLAQLLADPRIVGVAASSSKYDSSAVRIALAHRDGAIASWASLPACLEEGQSNCPEQVLERYLKMFVFEKTRTDNLVAKGGNTQLFSLEEELNLPN